MGDALENVVLEVLEVDLVSFVTDIVLRDKVHYVFNFRQGVLAHEERFQIHSLVGVVQGDEP